MRENYALGDDRIVMVTSDRISAFDVVMREPIPGKGEVLTRMALFWFELLADVVPNHLTHVDPESVVAADEADQVRGRTMVVERLKPLPVEAVVRGYLAGSGWKDYRATGAICGVSLPPGLSNAQAPAGADFHAGDEGGPRRARREHRLRCRGRGDRRRSRRAGPRGEPGAVHPGQRARGPRAAS